VGRFLAIVGAIVILMLVAVYLGWFGFSSSITSDGNHEKVEVTMDKARIREDTAKVTDEVKELTRETGEGVKRIADKVEHGLSSNKAPLLVADRKSIELEPGARTTVKLTRSGSDLKALQLILTPSSSSNLGVSGGEFKAGEADSAMVIEAASGARPGSVNIEGIGDIQHVDVFVKSKL
jgi:hypothetical protein